jgi:esterase FrsA
MSHDIDELKQFAIAHAKAQNMPADRWRPVLARITDDASWVAEWTGLGDSLVDGAPLDAAGCFNLARFPFVDGPARAAALEKCVAGFATWARDRPGVERLDIQHPAGRIRAWAGGLSARRPRPLVVVLGGIVSVKEQWAPITALAGRLGLAVVVTEMPGVGENTLPYDESAWSLFPAVLDAVAGRADTTRTYALALSFSGHLALRWAGEDERMRGLATIGAPVGAFFTDAAWFAQLPEVTVATLEHLTGVPRAGLPEHLRTWALGPAELAALTVPVYYTASTRDEIIPPADHALLRAHVRDLRLTEYDDVHGSPAHVEEIRRWVPYALLKMSGARPLLRMLAGLSLALAHRR